MEDLHQQILQDNRSYLIKNITDVVAIVDVLFEKRILTENMTQDIMEGEKTLNSKIRKLLEILPKQGPLAFDTFCDALIQNEQRYIAKYLNKALADRRAIPVSTNKDEIQNSNPQQPAEYHQQTSDAGSNPQPSDAGSNTQPSDAGSNPQPRQASNGNNVAQPEEIIPVFQFPADWPGSLNMPPVDSKDSCTHEDVARIKRQNGQALIINNQEFSEGGAHFAKRMMSETDSNRLHQVLKSLSFQVQIQTDLNYEEMEAMLQRFSKIEHKDDVFILIILSYGGDGTVYCADGKEMKIQDIVNTYSTDKCGTLIGKPKLIFIQACGVILADGQTRQPQETQIDHAAEIIKGLEGLCLGTQGSDDADTNPLPDTVAVLPVDTSDSLVAMATGPDIKHANYGSVFILALSYVFHYCSKNQDLDTMLKMINRLQKDENTGRFIKLCEVRSSLKQKLYFLPGFPLKGNEADIDFPVDIPQPVPFVGSTPKA